MAATAANVTWNNASIALNSIWNTYTRNATSSNIYGMTDSELGGNRQIPKNNKIYKGVPGSIKPVELLKKSERLSGDAIQSRILKFL